ncbi:MAG TPA: HNH endonuclease [Candidatus Scalindua sp.]|nr:HNH endonuclease [Candidatus Scalindua sp.]
MISPQSHKKPRPPRKRFKRKHLNKKFYNSAAWRQTRVSYIKRYQALLWKNAADGVWRDRNGNQLALESHKALHLLSMDYLPCEICLKLYCANAYDTMEEGKELDHIEPLNPENALDSAGHGDPFDHDNLQLLCHRHHSKKSQREAS